MQFVPRTAQTKTAPGLRGCYGGNYAFYAQAKAQEQQSALAELDRAKLDRRREEQSMRQQRERQEKRQARGTRSGKQAKSGRRKKRSSYTSREPSEAQRQHYATLFQIEERMMRDGIDLEVRPS